MLLAAYLDAWGDIYPRPFGTEIDEAGLQMYASAMEHLKPWELELAVREGVKIWKVFPSPAEILAALQAARDREPAGGGDWNDSLRNPESQWNRAVRWQAWKDKQNGIKPREEASIPWEGTMDDLFKVLKAMGSEPMKGMRWTFEDDAEDRKKYGQNRPENGWRPREESWRRELERDARATKPPAWHAPIVLREPGED